jgi:hypothetical protein
VAVFPRKKVGQRLLALDRLLAQKRRDALMSLYFKSSACDFKRNTRGAGVSVFGGSASSDWRKSYATGLGPKGS